MQSFVLDVSACLPWCCEDEQTAFSDRRRRIPLERANEFLEQLKSFAFHIEPPPTVADFPRISDLAARHQITCYDAAYLDLAIRLGLPLATLDDDLRKAAAASSVKLAEARP